LVETHLAMTIDIDSLAGESASLDFKSSFDPDSKQDCCELIKDIVAISNSGGGSIVVGLDDDGNVSGSDIGPLLAVDPADVTNKIYSYTDQHFAGFEIVQDVCYGKPVAVIKVEPSRIPIVFTAHGGYAAPGGGQKAAFVRGSVYFRHGAKSEPGTTSDLRQALERELEQVKGFWLDGIRKVTEAPAGSSVQIVQQTITLKDTPEATPVRLTTDKEAPALGLENVMLRDSPEATAIRLTNDENAPTLSVMQADKLYPYRQKELLKRLSERLGGQPAVSTHDLQCVRRAYKVDEEPMFSYEAQHSPRKYTEAYVDWLVNKLAENPQFFQDARDVVHGRKA
jgi:hypothetical protein